MWRSLILFVVWVSGGLLFTQLTVFALQQWTFSNDHHVHAPVAAQTAKSH